VGLGTAVGGHLGAGLGTAVGGHLGAGLGTAVGDTQPLVHGFRTRGHICKLYIYYRNYTAVWTVTCNSHLSAGSLRTSPQYGVWPFTIKRLDARAVLGSESLLPGQ
jgi:hypothetical protein